MIFNNLDSVILPHITMTFALRVRRRGHQKLKDKGLDNNTVVVFSTDNGAENFTWPDGGQTLSPAGKEPCLRVASACPA